MHAADRRVAEGLVALARGHLAAACVVGSLVPVAERMTCPSESVTCASPAEPPSPVDGSWAWKNWSALGGSSDARRDGWPVPAAGGLAGDLPGGAVARSSG